jgi:hypothetical protein
MSDSVTPPPVIAQPQQKLVTIYLDNAAYGKGKTLIGSYADKHGLIEEHLAQPLKEGWRIANLQAFGGNSDSLTVRGWVVVVLEKS